MKIISLFAVLAVTISAQAQWLPLGATTGHIYNSNSGNVGIGTTAPTSKLEIVSDLTMLRLRGPAYSANTPFDIIHLGMQGGTGAMNLAFRIGYPYSMGVGTNSRLDFLKILNGNIILGTNVENQALGKVGIGTTTPQSAVEVRGPSIRISDVPIRYLEISQDDQGQPYGRNWTNAYAGGRQFRLTGWSHLPDNTGSLQKDIVHFDGYNLLLLKDNGGSVGIGTSMPDATLTVKGAIHAHEVRVDLNVPGPDYVFEKSYPLVTLKKLNEYIQQNRHLPEIPSACSLEENGINIGEMNMLLLKKVEELTLYAIEQNNQAELQNKKFQDQEEKIKELERLIHDLIKSGK
jgi:hypothetical protein